VRVKVSTLHILPSARVKKPNRQQGSLVRRSSKTLPLVVAMMVMLATLVRPSAVLLSQLPINQTIPHQTATPAVSLTPNLSSGSGVAVGSVRILDSARAIAHRLAEDDRLIVPGAARERGRRNSSS
jgi:hypothetical protein